MLLGYGAKNCWCFKEWLDIDLRLNGYVPENISLNKRFSLIMGFQGANASGKTNALKIFAFIADFVKNSFSYSPESEIIYDSFFNNTDDSEFYVEFTDSNDNEYRYETVLQKKHVVRESIIKVNKSNEEIVLCREGNIITVNKIYSEDIKLILRNNASVVSTLYQYGIKEIAPFYSFFFIIFINVNYKGLSYELNKNIPKVSEIYINKPEALSFVTGLIKNFDTGISDIKIKYVDDVDNKRVYYPVFFHENNKSFSKLDIYSESTGTKALFTNLLYYYLCIKFGGVLILDEFDINLHPDILPHLLNLFTNADYNTKNAQLIFTSMNSDIMDKLGKYRIYLFEKENGESYSFRLDEPKTNILRNDRSVSEPYRRHYLGGVPKIEAC